MSRPLHQWIAIRKERRKIQRKISVLVSYLIAKTPPAWKNGDPGEFRAAIMFLAMNCDFECYRQLGHSMTGAHWVKGENYPIPVYPI